MKVRHPKTGRAHFSLLKHFDKSPAHYKVACENAAHFEPTWQMRLGTATHSELFGDRPDLRVVTWKGESRREKGFQEFERDVTRAAREEGIGEVLIITCIEKEKAEAIAAAVKAHPVAAPILFNSTCEYEVPLTWNDAGIECGTGGIDVLNRAKEYAVDFKTTQSVQPMKWMNQAWSMRYHAQAAFYERGCLLNGIKLKKVYCIGAEIAPPYAVTVLEYARPLIVMPGSVDILEHGRQSLDAWLEKLRVCEMTDEWPAYVLAEVPWQAPSWVTDRLAEVSFDNDNEAAQ